MTLSRQLIVEGRGLTTFICTKDVKKAFEHIDRIKAGQVQANMVTTEIQVPFGDMKETSSGYREQSKIAVDLFAQSKTVYINCTGQEKGK